MKIRLIATDLDGTLFDDEKKVPEENLAALHACRERGILIVPATGRTAPGLPEQLRGQLGVRYAILLNGGVVMDLKEKKELASCRLPAELAVRVMETARDSGFDVMYDAYLDGIGYTRKEFYENLPHFVKSEGIRTLIHKTRRAVDDNVEYIRRQNRPVDKVNLFFADMEERGKMRKILGEIPGILVSSSIPNNLEINAAGAHKGDALARLAERLGIGMEEVMAFGDGENDLTMLKMAGFGVAMGNADPSVKEAADYVTGSNNEAGLAAALKRFVLE